MDTIKSRSSDIGIRIAGIILALAFTSLVIVLSKAPPFLAYWNILQGAFGSTSVFANTLVAWVPLLLSSAGLLVTFAAGLWNIGIEGQITIGAVFATWVIRGLLDTSTPAYLIIALGFLAGMLGGAFWAALAGALKTFGGVNEIFGGLGLNFVASALTIWLIFGPWKRPGIASMSGTSPFPDQLWLPTIGGARLSPLSLVIAIVSLVVIYILLNGTFFGLQLKAVGKNSRASFLMGIPTSRYMMSAFLICGVFAGLAGAVQVIAVYHRLIPSISSGYGFLGLLVAMLVNYSPLWIAPIAFFFAALNIGSIQLPIVLKLDSTLSGVLQGSLVLFVLMVDGFRKRFLNRSQG
jgi:general nucleoside transport system permease protein